MTPRVPFIAAVTNAEHASAQEAARATADAKTSIADAQTAAADARTARADAQTAAADAKTAAQDAAAQAQGAARPPGTIVINRNDGEPISFRVDGTGIHVTQGETNTTIPLRDIVPRGAVQMTYAICAMLVAVAFVGPLLRFFLRRHERRAISATVSAAVQARLDAMECNIDTVAVELERVSEGQRFTSKLLEQRSAEAVPRV